jgi:hypothetical protein
VNVPMRGWVVTTKASRPNVAASKTRGEEAVWGARAQCVAEHVRVMEKQMQTKQNWKVGKSMQTQRQVHAKEKVQTGS